MGIYLEINADEQQQFSSLKAAIKGRPQTEMPLIRQPQSFARPIIRGTSFGRKV